MRAAVLEATEKPFVVRDVPTPPLVPNGVILRVEANGICRSDWHIWKGDWSSEEKMTATERAQIALSDVVSFHNYNEAEEFEKRLKWLQRYNRPILCTEYMARGNKSTFQGTMPVAKKYKVAAYNWGLVVGKTQTHLPWDSWQKPYVDREPPVWFHDIFRPDGSPYDQREVHYIRHVTGRER